MESVEPQFVDDAEITAIGGRVRDALFWGAVVVLSVAVAGLLESGIPLMITGPAWLAQVILGLSVARRAKQALRKILSFQLPVDMVVQDQLRKMRRNALIIGWLGLIGGLIVLALGGLVIVALGSIAGAWGRPLRAGQKSVGATIGERGHRWAAGPRPEVDALDAATREALGRMWLHDAQKEHGSVPAFAQVTWQLAMLGAPAELLERCHHAALQEIEHTRLCFALTETYLGRSFGVGPIEGVPGQLSFVGNRLRVATRVAIETLEDGCLIEDLNADLAQRAAARATDSAAKQLAEAIATEEREHAELAWDILDWCVRLDRRVLDAVARALPQLPTRVLIPYSSQSMEVILAAQPEALEDHGRVPFDQWPEIYRERRAATVARVNALLAEATPSRADERLSTTA